MERKIYIYTCMECGLEWESTKEELICPMCKLANIHEEEVDDDNEDTL